ncbi:MAG: T9SS type A sorting domain-containing protein, partial [Fibrobacter sp.]|nr:T9SS type A sorting domain-containing protein [Fibrobacter sp.]
NDNTIAALTKDNDLVVAVRNGTSSEKAYSLNVSSFGDIGSTVAVHQFSLPGKLVQLDNLQLPDNKRLSIKSPAQTVTTYIFSNVSLPPCIPSSTLSYVIINDQSWEEASEVTLKPGDSIKIGPHPYDGGSWSWKGPQNFNANVREITLANVTKSYSGEYFGTFVNSSGCSSGVVVKVNVDDPNNTKKLTIKTAQTNTKVYMQNNTLVVLPHESPLTVQIFTLRGAMVYRERISRQSKIPLSSIVPYGNYIVRVNAESGKSVFKKKLFISKK